MSNAAFMLTGEQIRAARALARVEQTELARSSGLSLETIKRLERLRGPVVASVRTLSAIVSAFAAIGIQFDATEDGSVGVFRTGAEGPPAIPRQEPSRMAADPNIHRLIYSSTAKPETAADMKRTLGAIQRQSEERNAVLGVTGCLYAGDGRFLQVLEGTKEAVWQVYGAISSDPRHTSLSPLESRAVATRIFPDWSLCCGRFPSDDKLFDTEPAFAGGFRPEHMSPAAALGLLAMVRELQRVPPRNRRGSPSTCALAADCLDTACGSRREVAMA